MGEGGGEVLVAFLLVHRHGFVGLNPPISVQGLTKLTSECLPHYGCHSAVRVPHGLLVKRVGSPPI